MIDYFIQFNKISPLFLLHILSSTNPLLILMTATELTGRCTF